MQSPSRPPRVGAGGGFLSGGDVKFGQTLLATLADHLPRHADPLFRPRQLLGVVAIRSGGCSHPALLPVWQVIQQGGAELRFEADIRPRAPWLTDGIPHLRLRGGTAVICPPSSATGTACMSPVSLGTADKPGGPSPRRVAITALYWDITKARGSGRRRDVSVC